MADSLSIQPVALSGLAGIPSLAFRLLTAATTTSTASIFASSSNLVELSSSGQLLSAVSSFRNSLQALPANAADSSPAAILATAQGLVDAFNRLQGSTASLQSLVAALPGNTLATQFSRTLNQLATASIAAGSANLGSLQSIGIEFRAAAAGSGSTLRIDPGALNAAISADPVGTQALLAGTTRSLIDLATGFEAQVAGATASLAKLTPLGTATVTPIDLSTVLGLPTTSTVQGIGVATDLLQNLNADTVLNAIRLTDLDLAAVGLDASTLLSESTVLRGTPATTLLTPNTPATATENRPASVGATDRLPGTSTPSAAAATAPTVETPIATMPGPTTSSTAAADNGGVATSAALGIADAMAADRRASEATLALQALVSDPSVRAINNLFDPAYSALIAASHLSDFVLPDPAINLKTIAADVPGPVSRVATSRAIAYYNEAAGEAWDRIVSRIDEEF